MVLYKTSSSVGRLAERMLCLSRYPMAVAMKGLKVAIEKDLAQRIKRKPSKMEITWNSSTEICERSV